MVGSSAQRVAAQEGDNQLVVEGVSKRFGGVVAVQMDRLPRGMRGRKVELFGSPFEVPEGPLRLDDFLLEQPYI